MWPGALKRSAVKADRRGMRRMASERRRRQLARLARWFDIFWWCRCNYGNVATYRGYHCGARPPRHLRSEVAAISRREERPVAADA